MPTQTIDNDLHALTHAVLLAGSVIQAEKAQRARYLPHLIQAQQLAENTDIEAHSELKRIALAAVKNTIQYVKTGRFIGAKLTRVAGARFEKELQRLAQRGDGKANGD